MGRTKESVSYLQQLFTNVNAAKTSCLVLPPLLRFSYVVFVSEVENLTNYFWLMKAWNDACTATFMRYWALVIGCPTEKEGVIRVPLTKVIIYIHLNISPSCPLFWFVKIFRQVLLDDGKTERIILAHPSGVEPSQEAVTEYRVLGPMINGCSWLELRPHTSRKHQVHRTLSINLVFWWRVYSYAPLQLWMQTYFLV